MLLVKAEINGVKMEGTPDEIAAVVKLVGATKVTTFEPHPSPPSASWWRGDVGGRIAGTYVGDPPNGACGYSAITFTTIAGGV